MADRHDPVFFYDPRRVAGGYFMAEVDGRCVVMTEKGWDLLRSIGTGRYVSGPRVVIVRKLVDGSLATLRDDGNLKLHGRADGERWWVEMSALGRVIVDAWRAQASVSKVRVTAVVRMTDADGETTECTLGAFLAANPTCFDAGEEERFAAGEIVVLGGGAAPEVRVQLVQT